VTTSPRPPSNRIPSLADLHSCKHMLAVVETTSDAAAIVRALREICYFEGHDPSSAPKMIDLTTDEGYRALLQHDLSVDQKRPNDTSARLLGRVIGDLTASDVKSDDARVSHTSPKVRSFHERDEEPILTVAPLVVTSTSESVAVLAAQCRSANVFLVPIITSELALGEPEYFQRLRANCQHFALAPRAAAPQHGRNFTGDIQFLLGSG
jgi:hypothetical protein